MANQYFTPEELKNEKWRDVPGYEGYQVSNLGRVRSLDRYVPYSDGRRRLHRGQLIRPGQTPQGYLHVMLGRGSDKTVHSLVILAFVGPPPSGKEINHKDGNRRNNRLCNLEYVSHVENTLHGIRVLGGVRIGSKGERNPNRKLTEREVLAIRAERERYGTPFKQLGEKYGVNKKTAMSICHRETWTHI